MKTTRTRKLVVTTLACGLALVTTIAQAADPLPSWNDGKVKQSIRTSSSAPPRPAARTSCQSLSASPPLTIGKLDKALDEAKAKGWTVVDMKRDWKRIFPF